MGLGSTTLIVVGLMVTAPMLMGWVGAEYAGGTRVLIVIAGASIPIAMNSLLGPPLIAAGRLWTRCTADVVLAGLLVAAAWLLLPAAGGMGLPLAYVAAYGVIALWMTRSVWRLYERHAVDGMRRP
jgi:O-antigen/teichoic acid export membrane protein